MRILDDELYSAILRRRSRRKMDGRVLSDVIIHTLSDFTNKLNEQILGARTVLVTENPDKVFKGIIGSYGKVKGASAYMAFIGDMKEPTVQEKVGYLGETAILKATSIGLATCWIGGFFKPDVVQTQIRLNMDEQVLAVSPVGIVSEQYTLEETMMSGLIKSHKRKKLDTLCLNSLNESQPSWMRAAVEAARLAPSAVNRQPWRFFLESDAIRITLDNSRDSYRISKRLDCGIAMAHLEIGAKHEGITGEWEYLTGIDVARFKKVKMRSR